MNLFNNLRLGNREQIVIALNIYIIIGQTVTTVIRFFKPIRLNHAAHGAIYN